MAQESDHSTFTWQQVENRELESPTADCVDVAAQDTLARRVDVPKPNSRVGLALSGGGIRSATFCLGVLQALAQEKRLSAFDYLSTVSGGGYIGSWLTAWIHRSDLDTVQRQLACRTGPSEPAEVTWLRRYSNYLTPKLGLFSLDSLTLVATWLRNCALNLVVILSFLGALFLLPMIALGVLSSIQRGLPVLGYAAVVAGQLFLVGIGFNLYHQSLNVKQARNKMTSPLGVYATVMMPGLITATLSALWFFPWPKAQADLGHVARIVSYGCAMILGGWLSLCVAQRAASDGVPAAGETWKRFGARLLHETVVFTLAGVAALAAGGVTLLAMHMYWGRLIGADPPLLEPLVLTLAGPPAVLLVIAVASTVFTGLVGSVYAERSREWWSRMNAGYLFVAVAWLTITGLSFYALPFLIWVVAELGPWSAALGGSWFGTLLIALLGSQSASTPPKPALARRKQQVVNVAAAVFVAGLMIATAAATSWIVLSAASIEQQAAALTAVHTKPGANSSTSVDAESLHHARQLKLLVTSRPLCEWSMCGGLSASPAFIAFGVTLALLMLFSWRVDINKFSLHNMYKNRLVRCYLGASRQSNRNAAPFTGLDDKDDFPLSDLEGKDGGPPQRPFHIVNVALNISQGIELAWQERKAASFVFTPSYSGYAFGGSQGEATPDADSKVARSDAFKRTVSYGVDVDEQPHGITLGAAMATSGAAVSPNQGPATSPSLAFFLTVFNARLGLWSPNPAHDEKLPPSPRFGLVALLQELFGYSNERRRYVYLSDGGHFDNLGVYELVRRRCKLIVAVDATGDAERQFDDLAETIRKCRVDLGAEIEFKDDSPLRAQPPHTLPEASYLVGSISYNDSSERGVLLYLKPTLTRGGDEPVDVRTYAALNLGFPHQSTADQFFDESQFEAYRRLGEHQGQRCLKFEGGKFPSVSPPGQPPLTHKDPHKVANPNNDARPALATRFVGWLLRRDPNGLHSLSPDRSPRDDSLVDHFIFGLAVTLVGFLIFWLYDKWVFGSVETICFSPDRCKESVEPMFTAAFATQSTKALYIRTLVMDGLFVLVYCVTLGQGYWVAASRIVDAHLWRALPKFPLYLVLMLAVTSMAAVDYAENVRLLEMLSDSSTDNNPGQKMAAALAPLTALKWRLSAVLVGLLMVLGMIGILPALRERWASSSA